MERRQQDPGGLAPGDPSGVDRAKAEQDCRDLVAFKPVTPEILASHHWLEERDLLVAEGAAQRCGDSHGELGVVINGIRLLGLVHFDDWRPVGP